MILQNKPRFATQKNCLWIPTLLIILSFFPLICLLLVYFQCPASFRDYNILMSLMLHPVILWLIWTFKKKLIWIFCGSILFIFYIVPFFQGYQDFHFLVVIIYLFIFLIAFSLILLPNLNIYLGPDQKLLRIPYGSYHLFPLEQPIKQNERKNNSQGNHERDLNKLVFNALSEFSKKHQESSYYIGPDQMGYTYQSLLINQPLITWNKGKNSFQSKTISLALFCFDKNIKVKWLFEVPSESEKRITFESCLFDDESNVIFILTKEQNVLIYSFTRDGSLRWEKEFSSNSVMPDYLPSGAVVHDRFIVGAKIIDNILITCISSRGNILWEQAIENKNNLASRYIIDPDSNFIIGFSSETSILLSIDKDGNKLWEQTVTGTIF